MSLSLFEPLGPLFDMTTGYNGKFVLVGEFSVRVLLVDGVVSKSLDRLNKFKNFLFALEIQRLQRPSAKRPCMTYV